MSEFEDAIKSKLKELDYASEQGEASKMYNKFCSAVHYAVQTVLPTRTRKNDIKRNVSERTKSLYEERTNKQGTQAEFDALQKK